MTYRLEVCSPRGARPAPHHTTTTDYAGPREAAAAFVAELAGSGKQVHLIEVDGTSERTIANATIVELAEPGEDEPEPEPAP